MTLKIAAFLLIFLINVAIGIAILFMLMLSLNGFSERDANYAFAVFIGGGFLISLLMGTGGVFLVKFLSEKQWNAAVAIFLSVAAFVVLGLILKIGIFFISIFVAEFVRTSR